MQSSHTAQINIPGLPAAATEAHVVPALAPHPLLSVGQLCDNGCRVAFDSTQVTVEYNNQVVLQGTRTLHQKLWQVSLPPPTTKHSIYAAITSASPAQQVAFFHAALFSPSLPTLAAALRKNFLVTFPGLTPKLLAKYPPNSIAMHKGHMKQIRQGIRSTKPTIVELFDDTFPPDAISCTNEHRCYVAYMDYSHQTYSDQTGKLFVASSSGNQYIMVVYDFDSNYIFLAPFKTRSAEHILGAFKSIHARLCRAGLRPRFHRLDNECSTLLKDFMHEQEIDFQLVGHGMHRRNSAERAIGTFECHFVAGLCSLDPQFPLHLWDELLPQAEITLNLLRGSRINPNLSAYMQVHGVFDYTKTPIAPPGIRVLAHIPPPDRGSFGTRSADAWYVGPDCETYRGYKCWIIDTRATRTSYHVEWFPTQVIMPIASTNDLIVAGIGDIIAAIQNPATPAPIEPLNARSIASLQELSSILTGLAAPALRVSNTLPTDEPTTPLPTATPAPAPALRVMPTTLPTAEPDSPVPSVPTTVTPASVSPAAAPNVTPAVTDGLTADVIGKVRRRRKPAKSKAAIEPTSTPPTQAAAPTVPTLSRTATLRNRRREHARAKKLLPKHGIVPKPPLAPTAPLQPAHRHNTRYRSALQATTGHTIIPSGDHHHAMLGNAVNPDTNTIAEYKELSESSEGPLWTASMSEELGRLAQGFGDTQGTDTIRFIPLSAIPRNKTPTYARVVSAYRPEKENPRRVRITVGGDRIDYPGLTSTKAADLTTVKLHINSVLSTPNARYATADIKDFYLNTPMPHPEYMRISLALIPQAFRIQYKLDDIAHNGFVYMEILKGMYGLPQAGRLANDLLTKRLVAHGYAPAPITPGLWLHHSRPISFTLVVDDFGIKYVNQADLDHFLAALRSHYKISEDMEGTRYCGLTLEWDYTARTCDISMPGYIERALQRFQHRQPNKPQHAPTAWSQPVYGAKVQYAPAPDASTLLPAGAATRISEITGVLLYYARAVDNTLLIACNTIASQQAKPTENTLLAVTQLLDYCATHPNAVVRFTGSDMILWLHSDASYLSMPKARSRAGGFYYLSDHPPPTLGPDTPPPRHNGAVNVLCQIMREVVSSAAEAELGSMFHNAKEACSIRIALEEMGHPQPATPLQTDNITAAGIANDTVKQKRSKAMDMRFYWLRDRVSQGQFQIYWSKGAGNKADYFTKDHPPAHHQAIRSTYLHVAGSEPNYFERLRLEAAAANAAVQTAAFFATPNQQRVGEGVL